MSTKAARKELAEFIKAELGLDRFYRSLPGTIDLPCGFLMPSPGDGGYISRSGRSTSFCGRVVEWELRLCISASSTEAQFDQLDDWADALFDIFAGQSVTLDVDERRVSISDIGAGLDEIGGSEYFFVSAVLTAN